MLNLHHSRSPHFPSVLHCLANFALVKLQCGSGSGSGSFILDFSLLSGPWPWESKFCAQVSKPLCKLLVEDKLQKQLIDRAKPNDGWCTPNLLTVPFHYHFDLNGGILSKIDLIVRHVSYFKFVARAIKPHFHATSVFLWKRSIAYEAWRKNPGLERDLNPWPLDTGTML